MKQVTIAFDVDGVILDLWSSVVRHLREEGIDVDYTETDNYAFKGHPYREDIFRAFGNPDVFSKAELYNSAKMLLGILDYSGVDYYFKSVSYNLDVENAKIKRLSELLPTFDKSRYIGITGHCDKAYEGADIVVEDNPAYFKSADFVNSDKTGVVIDRPYNTRVRGKRIVRIYNLSDLLKVTDCWHTKRKVV